MKIVRIVYFDEGSGGKRTTRFFANVDAVSWFDDELGPDSGALVLDWYADHDENSARAKGAAGAAAMRLVQTELMSELAESVSKAQEVFGTESKVLLSATDDHESGQWYVRAEIVTPAPPTEAMALLHRFYDFWLNQAVGLRSSVVWNVRHLTQLVEAPEAEEIG